MRVLDLGLSKGDTTSVSAVCGRRSSVTKPSRIGGSVDWGFDVMNIVIWSRPGGAARHMSLRWPDIQSTCSAASVSIVP